MGKYRLDYFSKYYFYEVSFEYIRIPTMWGPLKKLKIS